MIWIKPKFGKFEFTQFGWQARYSENLFLGKKVKIGAFTKLDCLFGIEIGDNTDIASCCVIASMSSTDGKSGKIVIGKNVKIGANAVVLPNVTIGDGAVIGALSLVKNDVPAGEVWCGIPARFIKKAKKEAEK